LPDDQDLGEKAIIDTLTLRTLYEWHFARLASGDAVVTLDPVV
jgi:hypothetical protein